MKVTVKITKSFSSAAKPLLKKYHYLSKDLLNLEKELIATPRLGTLAVVGVRAAGQSSVGSHQQPA